MASEGWPLSWRRIFKHVLEICIARYGPSFPGLGKNWIDHKSWSTKDDWGVHGHVHSTRSGHRQGIQLQKQTILQN
jgi:hypothetical protein